MSDVPILACNCGSGLTDFGLTLLGGGLAFMGGISIFLIKKWTDSIIEEYNNIIKLSSKSKEFLRDYINKWEDIYETGKPLYSVYIRTFVEGEIQLVDEIIKIFEWNNEYYGIIKRLREIRTMLYAFLTNTPIYFIESKSTRVEKSEIKIGDDIKSECPKVIEEINGEKLRLLKKKLSKETRFKRQFLKLLVNDLKRIK